MEKPNSTPESTLQPKAHITGKVIKTTIAGVIVDIGQKVPGVIHISQLKKDAVNRVEDVVRVGQTIDIWVRRIHDDRIELTMIEPLTLEWREISPDMLVKGKVSRLEAYGAFIEIGAERPGLVHVSEISHGYVKSPADVLKEGDEVEVKIIDVDRRKKQIRLSIKATQPKPEVEIVEVKKTEPRKEHNKKIKKQENDIQDQESKELELTSFQIAFQKAQERSGSKDNKGKKTRSPATKEQEEILHRTLESRITTN